MVNKKKVGLIGLTGISAAAILMASSLALFTDSTDSDLAAKAGTVDINLSELALSNSDNINPGDCDPTVTDDASEGTTHDLTYTVTNLGNKSAKTRQTIILSCNEAGESTELLDARYLALYDEDVELTSKSYIASTGVEFGSIEDFQAYLASYLPEGGTAIASAISVVDGVTYESGETTYYDADGNEVEAPYIKAVKYVFFSDSFNGYGDDAEIETASDVVVADEEGTVSKDYALSLALLKEADNTYQSADIDVNIVVEALQYRNTEDSDWDIVSTVTDNYSVAEVELKTTPKENEDADGNEIEITRGGTEASKTALADASETYAANSADSSTES